MIVSLRQMTKYSLKYELATLVAAPVRHEDQPAIVEEADLVADEALIAHEEVPRNDFRLAGAPRRNTSLTFGSHAKQIASMFAM